MAGAVIVGGGFTWLASPLLHRDFSSALLDTILPLLGVVAPVVLAGVGIARKPYQGEVTRLTLASGMILALMVGILLKLNVLHDVGGRATDAVIVGGSFVILGAAIALALRRRLPAPPATPYPGQS